MAQSIKLGSDTYLDWSGLAVDYEDIVITCGTTQFHGLYYGDGNLTKATRNKCISVIVVNVANSRPVYCTFNSNTQIRIWSPASSTEASLRVYYKLP